MKRTCKRLAALLLALAMSLSLLSMTAWAAETDDDKVTIIDSYASSCDGTETIDDEIEWTTACINQSVSLKLSSGIDQTYTFTSEDGAIVSATLVSQGYTSVTVGSSSSKTYYKTYNISMSEVGQHVLNIVGSGSTSVTYYYLEVIEHIYVEDERTDATCTENGSINYTCESCGATKTEIIAATGHDYDAVVTEPTCTEDGYTTYTCKTCGNTYVDDIVSATGHTAVIDAGVEATCTESGLSEGSHCSVCGAIIVEQETIAPLGHTWDDGEVITEATCTETGLVTYNCTVCGSSCTETIPATGHDYDTEVTVEATCTDDGLLTYTCAVCGDSYTEVIPATGHQYDNGFCTVCGTVDPSLSGLYKSSDGSWYYYVDGEVQSDFTGLVKYSSGSWYYVENGKINFSYTGLVKHTSGSWYYVENGKINFNCTGLVKHTTGSWWYVKDGKMQSSFTGLVKHTTGSWWYVKNGKMQSSFTGIVKHTTGSQWYVKNGKMQSSYTGKVTYNGKTYNVVNGKVA